MAFPKSGDTIAHFVTNNPHILTTVSKAVPGEVDPAVTVDAVQAWAKGLPETVSPGTFDYSVVRALYRLADGSDHTGVAAGHPVQDLEMTVPQVAERVAGTVLGETFLQQLHDVRRTREQFRGRTA